MRRYSATADSNAPLVRRAINDALRASACTARDRRTLGEPQIGAARRATGLSRPQRGNPRLAVRRFTQGG